MVNRGIWWGCLGSRDPAKTSIAAAVVGPRKLDSGSQPEVDLAAIADGIMVSQFTSSCELILVGSGERCLELMPWATPATDAPWALGLAYDVDLVLEFWAVEAPLGVPGNRLARHSEHDLLHAADAQLLCLSQDGLTVCVSLSKK